MPCNTDPGVRDMGQVDASEYNCNVRRRVNRENIGESRFTQLSMLNWSSDAVIMQNVRIIGMREKSSSIEFQMAFSHLSEVL